MKNNGALTQELKDRTMRFGLDVIRLIDALPRTSSAAIIGKQLLRAATAVGANYRSACRARSKPDFISKITVVEEEADEALYWLEVLSGAQMVSSQEVERLQREADQLTAIFTASGRTARARS